MKSKKIPLIIFIVFLVIGAVCIGAILAKPSAAKKYKNQLDAGERYLSEGDYEKAIAAYKAAIAIDPNQPDAYLGLAEVYLAMGDYEKARNVLQEGFEKTQDASLTAKQTQVSQLLLKASGAADAETATMTKPGQDASDPDVSEPAREPAAEIDFDALNAITDRDERYAKALELYEAIKDGPNDQMEIMLALFTIMAECKAQPFGDEDYLAEMRAKFDVLLKTCNGSYCKATMADNGSITLNVYAENGDLLMHFKNYGTADEESIQHFYDEKGHFLYSEKIVKGQKEKGPVYQYDAAGRLVKATYVNDKTKWHDSYNGIFYYVNTDEIRLEYNANDELSSIKWKSYAWDYETDKRVTPGKNSQINFTYREDGYLVKPVFDAWEAGDMKIEWVYVCGSAQAESNVDWDNYYAYYFVDAYYNESEYVKAKLRLIKPVYDFGCYDLYLVNQKNPDAVEVDETVTGDGKYHFANYVLSGSRISSLATVQDLGGGMTYVLNTSFKYDSSSVGVSRFEKTLVYGIPVTLDQ